MVLTGSILAFTIINQFILLHESCLSPPALLRGASQLHRVKNPPGSPPRLMMITDYGRLDFSFIRLICRVCPVSGVVVAQVYSESVGSKASSTGFPRPSSNLRWSPPPPRWHLAAFLPLRDFRLIAPDSQFCGGFKLVEPAPLPPFTQQPAKLLRRDHRLWPHHLLAHPVVAVQRVPVAHRRDALQHGGQLVGLRQRPRRLPAQDRPGNRFLLRAYGMMTGICCRTFFR